MVTVRQQFKEKLIQGSALAAQIRRELTQETQILKKQGIHPYLAVILVGEDEASRIYIRHKTRACEEVGIRSKRICLPETIQDAELEKIIWELNKDPDVDCILLQLPLPEHLSTGKFLEIIAPEKDVDGFHPLNLGRLVAGGKPHLQACTAIGIMKMLESLKLNLFGLDVTVIGKSNLVGKPIAHHLLDEEATVTICHKYSQGIIEKAHQADILIVAVGVPNMVGPEWVKEGAVVIDVGINRLPNGKVTGDVDLEKVISKVSYITPVPGGVGPMTIAMLLYNTLQATKARRGMLPPVTRPRLWT